MYGNQEAIETLKLARRNLVEFGWTRGEYGKPGRPMCLMGAIWYAREDWYDLHAEKAVRATLKGGSIEAFNDHVARSREDIFWLIAETIDRLESE